MFFTRYLKNIILKFFESKDKEALVNALSTVLYLSPEEVARLRTSIASSSPFTLLKQIPGLGAASNVVQTVSQAFWHDSSSNDPSSRE